MGSKDSIFHFGRWHGKTFFETLVLDPSYYFWGKTQANPSAALKMYLAWVERDYHVDDAGFVLTPKDGSHDAVTSPPVAQSASGKKKEKTAKSELYRRVAATAEKCPDPPGCVRFDRSGSSASTSRQTLHGLRYRVREVQERGAHAR